MLLLKPHKPRTVEVTRLAFSKLLTDKDATMEAIDRAYSEHGLGTLAIDGVPDYNEQRRKALLQAWQLANLPREARRRLERPEHYFQVGWEHGEYGFKDGRDAYMGSFFSNPLSDSFLGEDGKQWRNAWPTDDLPTLKPAVQDLSLTMKGVAERLARYLDVYVRGKLPSLRPDFFERTVASTPKVNSRLIHYYPIREAFSGQWTGWHKDIGMLTCLTPALYTNEQGEEIAWSDPAVGLHAQTKDGEVVKVQVPKDCLIIQIGEAMEVLTGGVIKAIPHAVIPLRYRRGGPEVMIVSRNSMALFIDPTHQDILDIPAERSVADLFQCCDTTLLTPKL